MNCTLFDAIRVTISPLNATFESSSAVSLTWTASTERGAPVTDFEVTWCTEDNNCSVETTCLENSTLTTNSSVAKPSDRIEPLSPAVSLRVRVSPLGLPGNYSQGCFETPPEELHSVAKITAAINGLDGLWISWAKPSGYSNSSDHYELRYCVGEDKAGCPHEQQQQEYLNSCPSLKTVTALKEGRYDLSELEPSSVVVVGVKTTRRYPSGVETSSPETVNCFKTFAPGNVTEVTVKSIGSRSARLEWKFEPETDQQPQPSQYNVSWCILSGVTECGTSVCQEGGIDASITTGRALDIPDLIPWSVVSVNVSALYSNGSEEVSLAAPGFTCFKTLAEAPEKVKDLRVDGTDAEGATVTWRRPETANGPLDGYILTWCRANDFVESECAEFENDTITINSSSITGHRLIGLDPWTKYRITVVAFNRAVNGSEMTSTEAMVPVETDAAAPGTVTSLSAAQVTNHSLSLTWEAPDFTGGHLDRYVITYCVVESCSRASGFSDEMTWNSSGCKIVNEKRLKRNIDGLDPWTWIAVKVTAVSTTKNHTELFGDAATICKRTKMGVPGRPENITVKAEKDSLLVSWKPPEVPNGEIANYRICVSSAENSTCETLEPSGKETAAIVPWTSMDLIPWTSYNVSLAARNIEDGVLLEGEAVMTTVKTPPAAPSEPENLTKYENGTLHSIRMTWDEPKNPQGPLSGYNVSWSITDWLGRTTGSDSLNTSDHEAQIPWKAYSNYTVSVKAFHDLEDGSRLYGDSVSTAFRTVRRCSGAGASGVQADEGKLTGPRKRTQYRTKPAEPSAVGNFSVAKRESRTLFVNWSEPVEKNGELAGYVLSWSLIRGRNVNRTEVTARSVPLPFLEPNTEYSIEVFAYNVYYNKRLEGPSVSVTAWTLPEGPGPVTNLKAEAFKNNSVRLTWSPPQQPRGELERYVITYNATKPGKPSQGMVEINNDSRLSSSSCKESVCMYEVEGLAAEYTYTFDVRGVNVNVTSLGDPVPRLPKVEVPAGDPPPPKNLSLVTPDCPSAPHPDTQKAFVLSRGMFDESNGEIIGYDVVVGSSDRILGNVTTKVSRSELSRKQPTQHRVITPEGWNPFKKGDDGDDPLNCQLMHGQTNTVVCTIGSEQCDIHNQAPCNGPLRAGTEYGLYIIGYTRGGSRASSPEVFITALPQETGSAGAIVGGILTAVVIMAAILAVFVIHRRRLARQKQVNSKRLSTEMTNMNTSRAHLVPMPNGNGSTRKPSPPVIPEEPIEIQHHVLKDINKPIPKTEFKDHLQMMLKDSAYRFADEYERLVELSPQYPSDVARNPANSKKNRFTNIHPFDKSRVPLSVVGDDEQTSYINASFVKGCNSDREYIAAQGPNALTLNDFWRMIWEHDVKIIIMLTQFVEANKKKCEKYWPDDNKEHAYGSVLVRKDSSTELKDYTLTEFRIKSDDSSKWRSVRHIFFTAWKDHGVPEEPNTLIQFVRSCQGMFGRRGGTQPPILVHCSAGVGRTGTFIALDMCLQKLEIEDDIDIFHLILDLRECRRCMVQNEKQYTYLYHCVAAVIDEMTGKKIHDEPIYENIGALRSGPTC
ncbi:hypothetical protein V5799_033250 [Amblyomma americanum]|uniref:protein-tyrosine-phosphatase n=1 Tax=Amblyomma americanum TaxID=6943 RepID=A0AAQ4DNV1_AMBAM